MARLMEGGSLAVHQMDALIFGEPTDVAPEVMAALEARYPGLQATHATLQENADWKPGMIAAPVALGQGVVVFACCKERNGLVEYSEVRACIQKVCAKIKDIGCRRFAMPVIGNGNGKIHPAAFDVVVGGAVGTNNVEIDIYA